MSSSRSIFSIFSRSSTTRRWPATISRLSCSASACTAVFDRMRTACSNCLRPSRSVVSKLIARSRIPSGIWLRTSTSGSAALEVTRTRFPVAKQWQMMLAMVWVLPVPGGPWTTIPSAVPSRLMMAICWSLKGFGKKKSSDSSDSSPPVVCSLLSEPPMSSPRVGRGSSLEGSVTSRVDALGSSSASSTAVLSRSRSPRSTLFDRWRA